MLTLCESLARLLEAERTSHLSQQDIMDRIRAQQAEEQASRVLIESIRREEDEINSKKRMQVYQALSY